MKSEEIMEMMDILTEIDTDTYLKYKYMILAYARKSFELKEFFKKLFAAVDEMRPLMLEMKEGVQNAI